MPYQVIPGLTQLVNLSVVLNTYFANFVSVWRCLKSPKTKKLWGVFLRGSPFWDHIVFMCVYLRLLMTSLHMSRWQHVLVPYTVCVAVSGEFGLRRLNPAVVIERIRKGVKWRNNKREGDFQCPFPSRRAPDVSTLLSFYNGNMRYFFQNWLTLWPSLIYMHRVKFHPFEWISFSTSTMCVLKPAQNIKCLKISDWIES